MRELGGEPDYLVGAKPERDPGTFAEVVREAFSLEYGTTKDLQIAAIVGRDPSRVSQVLKRPAETESDAIAHLVSFLRRAANRERVVMAWAAERFKGSLGPEVRRGRVGSNPGAKTLRRADRLIREGQPRAAATVSLEAARRTSDPFLREQFLDRAFFALHRLDRPGGAMAVARRIAEGARERGEPAREAAAHLMRCRVLTGLADCRWEEVREALEAARNLLAAGPGEPKPYATATDAMADSYEAGAAVSLMERGVLPLDGEAVRRILERCVAEAKAARKYQVRFARRLLAARCRLLLGETFQAEEELEKAFRSGEVKNLNAYEAAGLVKSRIMAAAADPAERAAYLRGVILNCVESGDRYHRRLAEWELARLEAVMFPPLGV